MSENTKKQDVEDNDESKTSNKVEVDSVDLSVGEILRRARLSEGLDLQKVEGDVRIRESMLQAIEDMDLDKLPGWIYTVGFVRTYSDYLNLDSDKMISLLKSQVGERKRKKLHFPVAAADSASPDLWVIGWAAGALVILVLSVFLYQTFAVNSASPQRTVNDIPPVPVTEEVVSPPIEEVADVGHENQQLEEGEWEEPFLKAPRDEDGNILPFQKPSASDIQEESILEDYRVVINVAEESWVEIRDGNGDVLVSRVLKIGDQYYVPEDREGLTMTTGNIAGLQILVDGKVLNIQAQDGEVKRDVPLDPESLKEMFP